VTSGMLGIEASAGGWWVMGGGLDWAGEAGEAGVALFEADGRG
jgi:hypothetical protein